MWRYCVQGRPEETAPKSCDDHPWIKFSERVAAAIRLDQDILYKLDPAPEETLSAKHPLIALSLHTGKYGTPNLLHESDRVLERDDNAPTKDSLADFAGRAQRAYEFFLAW